MPFGIDDALVAAPAVASIIQQFIGQGNQQRAQNDALAIQMQNLALQKRQMAQQYELATAGRTNARGDQTVYIPGQGWVVRNSPDTASRIAADNALNALETGRQIAQGEPTRDRNLRRMGSEAQAAEPLLTQFAQGYDLPTKQGVKGKVGTAAATAATEANDSVLNATNAAALRTGSRTPISTIAGGSGATGLRTALASSDLSGDQMYESMLKAAQGNKLDPYNMLATRANGDVPRLTESVSGGLDSTLSNAAAVGALRGSPSGAGVNDASKGLAAQYMAGGQIPQVGYDALSGVLAKILRGSGAPGGGGGGAIDDYLYNRNRDPSYKGGGGF